MLPVFPSAAVPRFAAPVLPAPSILFAPSLPAGRVYSAVQAPVSSDEGFLAGLVGRPPRAVVLDYDNTLADRGPNGLSLPVSNALVEAVSRLLRGGIPVILASSRHYEAPDAPFPMDLKTFIDRIPRHLRRNVLVSGGVGSELVGFDSQGAPLRLMSQGWGPGEEEVIRSIAEHAAAEFGAHVQTMLSPGQLVLRLPKGDERGPELARAVSTRLQAAGFLYKVLQNKEFVYFSRSDKGQGLNGALAALPHRVAEEDLLVLGDEFGLPDGGDSAMALAAPRARHVSVGDAHSERMAPGVQRMGVKGGAGALLVLKAVLAGLGLWP